MDHNTEEFIRAAIDKHFTFSCNFYYKGSPLEEGTVIISEGGKVDDWIQIKADNKKCMEESGVQLRADSGGAKRCIGGDCFNTPSSSSCIIHYKGLYCASRTKIWKTPKERKRSHHSKRSSSDCKACIRFQYNGVSWKVNKVVTKHTGHCPSISRCIKKLSECDKTELHDLIVSDHAPVAAAISNFMLTKGICLTAQDVRKIVNGWESRSLCGLELQIGESSSVSGQGQFATLIHDSVQILI